MWMGITNEKWRKHAQVPDTTRWDEVQRLPFTDWVKQRGIAEAHSEGVSAGLRRDVDPSISSWRPLGEVRVSASSLERYLDCPFVFAASRLLKLQDQPLLDLDLDHRTRGLFLHAILEEILKEEAAGEGVARAPAPRLEMDREAIGDLVDRVREKNRFRLGEEGLWQAVRAQHIRLVERFLQMEREWRDRFPATETAGLETEFLCHWDIEKAEPIPVEPNKSSSQDQSRPNPSRPSITFSGRLDRVDRDAKGRYVLFDYKASGAELRNWSSWLVNRDLQMPLYALLLESGLTALPAGPVVASNFYVVKDQDRRKGFHLKGESADLYSLEDKHRNWMTDAQKQELFEQMRALIQETLKQILRGEFQATPRMVRLCENCTWRILCRAPHLS
jgi:ATP-dependent helicase/DNAse subunit B